MWRSPLICTALLLAVGCDTRAERESEARASVGGDPALGRKLVLSYGCTSCHTIPGIRGDANVGPPLARIGSRAYVGGVLTNTPDNLIRWLEDPPAVDAKTAMPNLHLSHDDARHVATYLYTLR